MFSYGSPQRYMPMLLDAIQEGKIDPSFVITHQLGLEDAPIRYDMFDSRDDCIKVTPYALVEERTLTTRYGPRS